MKDNYEITEMYVYKNDVKYAEIVEAESKGLYTYVKANLISENKYLNNQEITMQINIKIPMNLFH